MTVTTSAHFLNHILALVSTVMNPSCKLVNSTNLFIYHTERISYFTKPLFQEVTHSHPPFLLPTPPHLRLPCVPTSAEACWRPKIPADVTSNVLPVYRAAYENRRQGDQERYSRDLPKGNQKRAIVHHKVHIQYLLHSTGCC